MAKANRDWIVACDGTGDDPFGFKCLRCGEQKTLSTPVRMSEFLVLADTFTNKHKDCAEANQSKDHGELCDRNCNECPLMRESNAKMITVILNVLLEHFGDGVYEVVQSLCPNLTCCFDCHIDDFWHIEGCRLSQMADEIAQAKE